MIVGIIYIDTQRPALLMPYTSVSAGFFIVGVNMIEKEKCFIYVNSCFYNGLEVSKIGITNNVEKRLSEFNLGLTYRARYYPDLTDIKLYNIYKICLNSRVNAKVIEKKAHSNFKDLMLTEFGREVFNISPSQAIAFIDSLVLEDKDV